jgi:hypothetical protein
MLEDQKILRRSPNFPSLSLSRAIELAERVYSKAFTSAIETSIFLELMGFKGVSGASRTAMATLKQYGLLEGRDDNNKITRLAEQIIHPIDELDRHSAILEAAKKPIIYQEIFSQFKGSLPDDKVLKSFLIRKHNFSESGADTLIKSLRETEDFILPIQSSFNEAMKPDGSNQEVFVEEKTSDVGRNTPDGKADFVNQEEFLKVKVTPETTASVFIAGPISRRVIERLIAYLELSRDTIDN